MIRIYHVTPAVNGYEVLWSTEKYFFRTQSFADTFCKLLNEYERTKYLVSLTSTITSGTITFSALGSSIIPTFNIPFSGVTYRLDLSKPPNLFAKVFLKLMGFKK